MKDNVENLNDLAVETYNIIAEQYNKEFGDDMSDIEYINKFLKIVDKGKILDVGCGVGNLTHYIKNNGFEVIGIDLSEKMLDIAEKRFKDIEFKKMDMTNIEFAKNSFDALFVAYSLFHIPNNKIEKTINGFVDILKEQGKIMFILQEGQGEVVVDEPFAPSEKMFINYFTREEITKLLEKHGFSILYLDARSANSDKELGSDKLFVIAELN